MHKPLQFEQLGRFLLQYYHLWSPRPFKQETLPWSKDHPALHDSLLALSDTELEALTASTRQKHQFFSRYLPEVTSFISALDSEPTIEQGSLTTPAFADVGIPGRKWQQLKAFAQSLPRHKHSVEWCSGKGHLSRLLLLTGSEKSQCLEIDEQLIEKGKMLATKSRVNIKFHQCNVLEALPNAINTGNNLHFGLHACGDLHLSFLKFCVQNRVPQLAIAPCCFHKIRSKTYPALSKLGQRQQLHLNIDDLKLPQEASITCGQRTQILRKREQIWRLAYNSILQAAPQQISYHPLPSVPKSRLGGSFEAFCRWAASIHHITLPGTTDYQQHLAEAAIQRERILRLDMLRLYFQRAIEYWLMLDKVCYLEENHYVVKYGTFCQASLTPRNLMLVAKLAARD